MRQHERHRGGCLSSVEDWGVNIPAVECVRHNHFTGTQRFLNATVWIPYLAMGELGFELEQKVWAQMVRNAFAVLRGPSSAACTSQNECSEPPKQKQGNRLLLRSWLKGINCMPD